LGFNGTINIEQPLVSVVIPCYDAEQYVEDAVRSIMKQSYTNLEIITIDDCSTDNTLSVLKKLCAEDSRIVLLLNEKNLGLVSTLNKGISSTRGKYVARMDADDISMPDRISIQVKYLEANGSVGMCGANYILIDEKAKEIGKLKFPGQPENIKTELLFYCPFCHPLVMIRKSVFDTIGLYNEGLVPAEDYELWLRIAEKFPVENIPDFLLYYRWHGNNVTLTRKKEQYKALKRAVENNLQTFGFAENFLNYHLKFLAGLWYQETSREEINGFTQWKQMLLNVNERVGSFNKTSLKTTFDKYFSLAMLSIIKSKKNKMAIKLLALKKLLLINPIITAKHFLTKAGMK
jgi:glycosyltransferase involved in cell wall biosynthesis